MPSPSAPKKYCPVDRYLISDLSTRIADLYNEDLDPTEVADFLDDSVNDKKEYVSPEHLDLFTRDIDEGPDMPAWKKYRHVRDNTISAHEAYAVIFEMFKAGTLNDNTKGARIARYMHDVFFAGNLFSGRLHAPQRVRIKYYHDADTPIVERRQGPECNAGPSSVKVRTGNTDGSEVGEWNERLADKARFENEKKWGTEYPYKRDYPPLDEVDGWINSKMVGNVDKLHSELSKGRWDSKELPYKEREAIHTIIAATMDFTGNLATLPMNDLLSWDLNADQRNEAMIFDLQICWTSKDYPAPLCGSWQPYDIHGRALQGFEQIDSNFLSRKSAYLLFDLFSPDKKKPAREVCPFRLERFTRERLPVVMETDGQKLYGDYLTTVGPSLNALKKSGYPELAKLANEIVGGVPKPAEVYSKANCAAMADALLKLADEYGERVLIDDQAFQIIIGSEYDYMKYRNQRADIYNAAGKKAREMKFGNWSEPLFTLLWKVNAGDDRYSPNDCRKKTSDSADYYFPSGYIIDYDDGYAAPSDAPSNRMQKPDSQRSY